MKIQEFRKVIREEVRKVVKEVDNEPMGTTPIRLNTYLKTKSADPNLTKGLSSKEIKVIQDLIDIVLQKGQKGDVTTAVNKVKDILANMTKSIK